jgi:hypothetical protein
MNKIASSKLSSMVQRVLLAVLVVMVVLGSAPVNKARAWGYNSPTGRPGAVSVPQVYIADVVMPNGIRVFTLNQHTTATSGPFAYRSPATTGVQNVAAHYVVEKWDGYKWVRSASAGPFIRQIGSAQPGVYLPKIYIQPLTSRGYFRVTWYFAWATTTDIALGSTAIMSDRSSDHVCATPYRLCQSYAGYFRTGGVGTGAW